MTRSLRSLVLLIATAFTAAACCDDGVRTVDLRLTSQLSGGHNVLWEGDTLAIIAVAGTEPEMPCYRELYSSESNPERFTYLSSNPAVTTVSARGVILAHARGTAEISGRSHGVTSQSPMDIAVIRRIDSIRFTTTPAVPRVGDPVTVRATPLGAGGAVIDEAVVWIDVFPATGQTLTGVSTGRFDATEVGTFKVVAMTRRTSTGNPIGEFALDTLTLQVVPR